MSILEEVQQLKSDSIKYERMKTRYVEAAEHLRKVKEILGELQKDIHKTIVLLDPIEQIKGDGVRKGKTKSKAEEVWTLMQNGTRVNLDILAKMYPDMNENQVYYLFDSIRRMPNVMKSKYDKKIWLLKRSA